MTINNCTEIRSKIGGVFHLFKLQEEEEENCISIIDDGRISTIYLKYFDKDELIMLMRHINEEVQKK